MRFACLLVALGACNYAPSPTDTPDAGPCVALGPTCSTPSFLARCNVIGEVPMQTMCPWGCLTSGTVHCGAITPAGGAATATDLDPLTFNSLDVTLGAAIIDGSAGTILVSGNPIASDFHSAGNVAVFRFKSLHITGAITLIGTRAIALVSDGAIQVDSAVSATGCTGPSGIRLPGPGGRAGATKNNNGVGQNAASTGSSTDGAGGGGYGAKGGTGGGAGGGNGGDELGIPEIDLLVGGGGGAGGPGGGGGEGGGGGGALQLVSNTSIAIATAASIEASGCGGGLGGGGGSDGGGGAGAGGAILLEAPTITIDGFLAVNGGGGGGSGGGPATGGVAGALARAQAPGGIAGSGGGGGAAGGLGGAINVNVGGDGIDASRSSGGGGAVGRMRFNTLGGTATVDNLKLSPAITDTPTTCTQGVATIH